MRWRIAASIAILGMAGVPAVSDAVQVQPGGASTVHVSVNPRTGSLHSRFVVSFRAPQASGTVGSVHRTYRVAASQPGKSGCQASATASPPPAKAGANVRVVLAPGSSRSWCTGTFSGSVWDVVTYRCPPGEACPALIPAPRLMGKFSFRVTRG